MTFRVLGEGLPVDQIGGLEFYPKNLGVPIPLTIDGLQLWLKADAGTFQDSAKTTPAVSDGDVIGAWGDQSGQGNDGTQTTTANKPTLRLNVKNGMPIVRFDGINDFLSATGMTVASGNKTFFIATEPDSTGAAKHYFDTETGRLIFSHGVSTAPANTGYFDGAWHSIAAATTNWQILSFVMGASGEIFRDGASLGSDTYTARAIGAQVGIASSFNGSGAFFPGDVAEILLYDSALSVADRQTIETYLNERYAIF